MISNRQEIARRILDFMHRQHLTQKGFAELLEVTQPAVSKYLQGRIPPPAILLKLSRLSGNSIEWFLTGSTSLPAAGKIAENRAVYAGRTPLIDRIDQLPQSLQKSIADLVESIILELQTKD
jgi:transcriptional regulator with XRE-family HTH domain